MELKENDYSTVYVELDCFLDTRMATLFQMGEDVAMKAIEFGYHDRISDLIPGIDYQKFLEAYKKRDKRTLKNAMVTPIGLLLKDFALKTTENTLNSPFHYKPRIVLNVHPYELDTDEMELIRKNLYVITNGLAEIELICIPPEKITPKYVKTHFSLLIMYRYDEWLEIHSQNELFKKTIVPEVCLIAPRVYFRPLTKIPDKDEDAFGDMEKLASPLIGLQLRPASLFSLVIKPVKKEEFRSIDHPK